MRIEPGNLSVNCTAPVAGCLLIYVAVAGLGFYAGHWLMQPTVIPNAGLAAYPPATRLIPFPRKTGAFELADLPPAPVEPVNEQPAQVDVKETPVAATPRVVQKRPKPRQPAEYPASAYYAYGSRWSDSWSSSRGGWNARW
jgi:hypothetical protein